MDITPDSTGTSTSTASTGRAKALGAFITVLVVIGIVLGIYYGTRGKSDAAKSNAAPPASTGTKPVPAGGTPVPMAITPDSTGTSTNTASTASTVPAAAVVPQPTLPASTASTVPAAAVVPQPTLPASTIPAAAVVPQPTLPASTIPAAAVVPQPTLPASTIPAAAVVPQPTLPASTIPAAAIVPPPTLPYGTIPGAAIVSQSPSSSTIPGAAIVSAALLPALPVTPSATVAMHWDASVGSTVTPTTSGSTLVSAWKSKVGPVEMYSSSAGQVSWMRLPNGKPGVYIPTGTVMGTEGALPSPLFGKCVVVVATLRAPATLGSRTLLASRREMLAGGVALIIQGDARIGPSALSLVANGTSLSSLWYGDVTVPALAVPWGVQGTASIRCGAATGVGHAIHKRNRVRCGFEARTRDEQVGRRPFQHRTGASCDRTEHHTGAHPGRLPVHPITERQRNGAWQLHHPRGRGFQWAAQRRGAPLRHGLPAHALGSVTELFL